MHKILHLTKHSAIDVTGPPFTHKIDIHYIEELSMHSVSTVKWSAFWRAFLICQPYLARHVPDFLKLLLSRKSMYAKGVSHKYLLYCDL